MGISISYLSELISYDTVVSILVAAIVLLFSVGWFTLKSNSNITSKTVNHHSHSVCDNKNNNDNDEQDDILFRQPPPPTEDCPICFIRLPSLLTGSKYYSCCGKLICSGCSFANAKMNTEKLCAFCRTPMPVGTMEMIEREKKRAELDDPIAIYNTGCNYRDGRNGFPQDYSKALELWHRAAELGYANAYNNIGVAYYGRGVKVDKKKAAHYYELAAIGGCVAARYNLGIGERKRGNLDRALKHYIIGAKSGQNESLKKIQKMYSDGDATKEDYTKALRLYQEYLGEIKSPQRDEAAAFDSEKYRYY